MGDERAFAPVPAPALERLRHALWAAGLAVVLLAATLLDPLDQLFWLVQSRMGAHHPSGDIVFVSADQSIEDPRMAHRRADLADALDELDRKGVGQVYLDLVFESPSNSSADEKLGDAIARLGPRIVLVNRVTEGGGQRPQLSRSIPRIARSAASVADGNDANWLGFVWTMPYSHRIDGRRHRSFGAALGGQTQTIGGEFKVDYGIYHGDIPAADLRQVQNSPSDGLDLAGKTVVIGRDAVAEAGRVVPGQRAVPESYIAIFAAETLKSGRTAFVGAIWMLILTALALVSVILSMSARQYRMLGYAICAAMLPVALVATARLGIRIEIAYSIAMLAAYSGIRSWALWKRRIAMIDQETGLPTLRALEESIGREDAGHGHVVIAKIQGYEHVLKTLKTVDQSSYILKLVDRLRAADKELTVYFDGHFLGWHVPSDDTDALVEHLEGLRAIFAAPIQVSGYTVDVGITFGLARIDSDPVRRIPAAIAAVEETNEASQPIKIAESGSHLDMLWDISLRARIDEAMESGEVYCVYQPKVDIRSGEMTGVEALVRWHDPHRGFISPMHFIHQCEKAGRMEHLTRYVLQTACTAGQLLHFRGNPTTMAVNVSATLLGDMRIVGLVRNVLQATHFEPSSLVLEVTETARISDLSTAASILAELKSLGPRISIDDFGVGAANFETLFELPFDELKIDRLFISNIVGSAKARAIAASIVAMGREARISIVAEGAETPEELKILNEIGCSLVQGYAVSRPISLSNLLEFKAKPKKVLRQNMV